MPVCCRCNGKGRCIACACVKSGSRCIDCLPSRNGHCSNQELTDDHAAGLCAVDKVGDKAAIGRPDRQDGSPELVEDVRGQQLSLSFSPQTFNSASLDVGDEAETETGRPEEVSEIERPDRRASSPEFVEDVTTVSQRPVPVPGLQPEVHQSPNYCLPPFKSTLGSDQFKWGDVPGQKFTNLIEEAYSLIVHWRRNLFKVPSGSSGKQFVAELARLFNAFTTESAMESIALTAAMTFPALMLQKPHAKSKVQEHIACLRRRLSLWEEGEVAELLKEGQAIQKSLQKSTPAKDTRDDTGVTRRFSKLMTEGNVRAALQLLTRETGSAPLKLNDVIEGCGRSVRDILKDKHPSSKPPHSDVILSTDAAVTNSIFHPVLFEGITADLVRRCALLTEGSAGPSGMDAPSWRRLCTAFGEKSNELCSAIAAFSRRICISYVDPVALKAYTSSRLVPLDKCPGVRPVGIGEVVRRIVGKTVMKIVKRDLQEAVGSIQLCAGQDAGCEAAVHAMERLFAEDDVEALILVDATNAFNQLNRKVTLLNCDKICPAMTHILTNTYRNNSHLYVDGQCLLSEEGTTQGDPLAMAMYAIGTLPLIHRLDGTAKQAWYADDSAAASKLEQLKRWWDLLNDIGPHYGYFPNGAKTHSGEARIC